MASATTEAVFCFSSAHGADLFICEYSSWQRPLNGHINDRHPDMLERRSALAHGTAADGMVVIL
jgi:hypothetical protein